MRDTYDALQAREFRKEAILLNHASYVRNIPIYKKLAQEEGISEITDLETIKQKLILSDDIFKSYSQKWLDALDFNKMNLWLSSICLKRINTDCSGLKTTDEWLDAVEKAGISVTYSSGTSGTFSFVPRDTENWTLTKTANTCYLAALLTDLIAQSALSRFPIKQAVSMLSPQNFMKVIGRKEFRNFDAFFLGFKQGRMGNQVLMQELAPIFRKHFSLYDIDITASTLRALRRGAQSEDENRLVDNFQNQVINQHYQSYLRLIEKIKASNDDGQKIFIFGAPYQFKELCEALSMCNDKIVLNEGSLIFFGGGWKSFDGEIMQRKELVQNISGCFKLPQERILEGYSMTEISMLMIRCNCGRFHIPPIIEPVIFDEALNPLNGKDLRGTFGFLDPLATSYPGFIISGDQVHLVDDKCECGLVGPAVSEIGRARNRDIKGCGGIMGSVSS
jgi:hypothetical protein